MSCVHVIGLNSNSAQAVTEHSEPLEPDWSGNIESTLPLDTASNNVIEWVGSIEKEPQNSVSPQNSLDSSNLFIQPNSDQNSFEMSYEPTSQSSFDPYGFKLSPEHSNHTLLDPDEAEVSPDSAEKDLPFDPEPLTTQVDPINFDPFGYDVTSSQILQDSDPYGFKLSSEEENQEVLDLCGQDNPEAMDLCTYDNNEQIEPTNCSNQVVLKPENYENQELIGHCSHTNQDVFVFKNGKYKVEPSRLVHAALDFNDNQKHQDLCRHDNQEVVEPYSNINNEKLLEPYNYDNQEVVEPCSSGSQKHLDFLHPENQEVLDLDGNQELLVCDSKENPEVLVSGSHGNKESQDVGGSENQELLDYGNQEVLDLLSQDVFPEASNNQCIVEPERNISFTNSSSDSDVASEDLLGLELGNTNICTANTTKTNTAGTLNMAISNKSANIDVTAPTVPNCHNLLEGDLGSVFGTGGYIGCPDVADDLEPLDRRQANPVAETQQPVRPVRPPRPSLRVSWKTHTCVGFCFFFWFFDSRFKSGLVFSECAGTLRHTVLPL